MMFYVQNLQEKQLKEILSAVYVLFFAAFVIH